VNPSTNARVSPKTGLNLMPWSERVFSLSVWSLLWTSGVLSILHFKTRWKR
jgi:hypothetical protein